MGSLLQYISAINFNVLFFIHFCATYDILIFLTLVVIFNFNVNIFFTIAVQL
jgi:hypothetical protein